MTNKSPANTELATIVESLGKLPATSVDVAGGIIRGVKLLGFESKNGRVYPPQTVRNAVNLYEGAKVNVNHPERDPNQPRGYEDRMGVTRSARIVEGANGGIYADFHYNPKHRLAEQLAWDAQHNPESLGFSHNALLRFGGTDQSGRRIVEQIVSVKSVDLVADPATTRSLFESEQPNMDPTAPVAPADASSGGNTGDQIKTAFRAMVMAAFDDDKLDMKATLTKIKQIMQAQEKLMGGTPATSDTPAGDGQESLQLRHQIALLSQQVEQFQAKEKQTQKLQAIETELKTAGLDKSNATHVSELFTKQLLACESQQDRAALIQERVNLVGVRRNSQSTDVKPRSAPAYATEGTGVTGDLTAEQFAARLRSR